MFINSEEVLQYIGRFSSPEDELLMNVAEFTIQQHPKHHMLSGHVQGKFLEMISHLLSPHRILEIGTFTGYSALCLAKGLHAQGLLHTIELKEDVAEIASSFFKQSFFSNQIILHIGEAAQIIGELDDTWDLVFIDADKENYINYFNLVFPKVRQKGFILADNTLFHGQVLKNEIKGKCAIAIQEFNEFICTRKDLEVVILPLRDGLSLIRKL